MRCTRTVQAAILGLLLTSCGAERPVSLSCVTGANADQLAERPSPLDSVRVMVGDAEARVCYGRPSARGRVVFGGLAPYDTLWRTGANEPTMLHLPFAAEVAGLALPAGSYSLYTVPSRTQWLLVVNRSTSQWGLTADEVGPDGVLFRSAYTDAVRRQEVGRVPIADDSVEFVEQFRIVAEPVDSLETIVRMEWERTSARFPIRLRTP